MLRLIDRHISFDFVREKLRDSYSETGRPSIDPEVLLRILPKWLPADQELSLVLVLVFCFLAGVAVRTRMGVELWNRVERSFFERMPGYSLIRSLTHRLAGEDREAAWKPALAEVEEALVPAFIIEDLRDGRFTVFVPSIPTPLAGAVYILTENRVHSLDVPFTQAIKTISRWGSGSKDLVVAMERRESASGLKGIEDVERKAS